MKSLGSKLVFLRKQNKLTQEQVAERLEITRQTVSNWELNQTKPDIEQIKGLSKLYNISVDELIDNDVKEMLTKKISNVEKLTGLVYRILILLLISLGIFMMVAVYNYFFKVESSGFSFGLYLCSLNGTTYDIYLESEPIYEKTIYAGSEDYRIDRVSITPYIAIPDLEKYNKHYQLKNLIFNYFETNGGHCMK